MSLGEEIDALIESLGGIPPSPAVARLERELALLNFHMKMARMTGMEKAIYFNGVAVHSRFFGAPVYSLHTRFEDLIEEMKIWLSDNRM